MLLVIESAATEPVGLLVLAQVSDTGPGIDLRIGYLLAEHTWGRGLATELVAGLVDWARAQPEIRTVTGGVDTENRASVRILEKCGFELIGRGGPGASTYRLEIPRTSE